MSLGADLEQARREEARWRVLRVLDMARPIGATETLIWKVLADVDIPYSMNEVRRELAYLRDRKLVEIRDEHAETWIAKLTATGVDIVEYTIPVLPGIARPPR